VHPSCASLCRPSGAEGTKEQRSQDASIASDACSAVQYGVHPSYPCLPSRVPLIYTLTMQACVSSIPSDRPTFDQAAQLLEDTAMEVAGGVYVDSEGKRQVRPPSPLTPLV
jgi:hypothetical protein